MKIHETQRIGGMNAYQKKHDKQPDEMSHKRYKDELNISSEALEMLASSHSQSSKRVQQLKESVSTGSYYVEAGKVAEKLLPYMRN